MWSGSKTCLGLGVAASLWLLGCTRSHDLPGPGLDADASVEEGQGQAGSTSRAGRGGSSGRAGTGGSVARAGAGGRAGSAAGSGGATAPRCGDCPDPGLIAGLAMAESCCTASGSCGLRAPALGVSTCQQLNGPGEEDDSCPGAVIANFLPLPGCCTPEGECGILDTVLGLGCARVALDAPMSCDP